MRYADPDLRDRLAAEYVLGTMPSRVRRRFERLMQAEPDIQTRVAAWAARLAPLDAATAPEAPPARVWQEIERRLPAMPAGAGSRRVSEFGRWFERLAFWRGLALATSAALAVAIAYIGLGSVSTPPSVIAVLTDTAGDPTWVATDARGEVRLSSLRPVAADPQHSFELWGIKPGEAPRALGLLPQERGQSFRLSSAELPPAGGVLAVTREPPNGSPTGSATGPILWQGKLLGSP